MKDHKQLVEDVKEAINIRFSELSALEAFL
jgi:hypothetical protein